jgi:hypothetical protein
VGGFIGCSDHPGAGFVRTYPCWRARACFGCHDRYGHYQPYGVGYVPKAHG